MTRAIKTAENIRIYRPIFFCKRRGTKYLIAYFTVFHTEGEGINIRVYIIKNNRE